MEREDGKRVDRSGPDSDMAFEERECETVVNIEAQRHALELLATWARRRGQKLLEDAGRNSGNRVNPDEIKGYGGGNGSN